MSFRINTNSNAMTAFRSLSNTGAQLSTSQQRLSTGLRINSGADDPSGLIASEGYKSQISGLDTAIRNNQNATNYAKTAEGALSEVSRLLQDARSLAIANGDGSLDATQKQANQTQLNNIVDSINRIASSTQFGSKNLLDGSAGVVSSVAKGANISKIAFGGTFGSASVSASQAVNINVTTAATQATGTGAITHSAATDTVGAGSFTLNGKVFNTTATTTQQDVVDMINAATGDTGVSAAISSNAVKLTNVNYGSDYRVTLADANSVIQTAGTAINNAGVDSVATVTLATSGTTATFNKGKGLELKDSDGNSISLTAGGNATGAVAGVGYLAVGNASFQIGGNAGQTAQLALGKFDASTLGVGSLDITGSSMSTSITALDAAIKTVSSARGNIGSFVKNTLETQVRSLGVAKENMSAANSTISEIDVAEEMTQYTKLQILQQSGLSILAQANQGPQAVLSLLR
ncbi:MAG: hypothetical protein JSS65_12910 [Armatimonadetes bacterium]|nr:hypothetical protein [Armatimonadota bacterium]